jgi:site-specific DNA recombinase
MKTPRTNGSANAVPPVVHCAVYCRKSTDENLDSAFNSLDAQREACLAYIVSQKHAGWVPHAETFEDAAFSGGTMERPALKRLVAEIEAGRVQCVLVYRADRLSRRIIDFLQLVEMFDKHGVSFVSVTEQFNTATPGGRLYQHMLLSFAQYERELIAERTRHKVHAARRRGRFTGGFLMLGYDRSPEGGRLVVNTAEAKRVREIFRLFIETPSIIPVAQELNRRGWTLKRWTTKGGRVFGGGAFDQLSLKRLLTSHLYVGQVRFDGQVFDGDHDAIIDQETWDRVQALLADERGPRRPSSRSTALLGGLLRCAPCDAAMTATWSQKRGRRYRYYVCRKAHLRGWDTCPSKSVPATEIERFVVDRIRAVGQDPDLIEKTAEEAGKQLAARKTELDSDVRQVRRDLQKAYRNLRGQLSIVPGNGKTRRPPDTSRQQETIRDLEARLVAVLDEEAALVGRLIDAADLREALRAFDPVWEQLTIPEQARVVQLLIERIDYDGAKGSMAITFRPGGVRTLATETATAAGARP